MWTTRIAILSGMVMLISRAAFAVDLYVQVGAGDWADANIKAFVQPFEKETGIKVVPVRGFLQLSQLKLMVESKNADLDVAIVDLSSVLAAAKNGWLEKIDYSIYKKEELDGMGETLNDYAVGSAYIAFVMAYSTKKYPEGTPHPTSWAEFWDTKKFPGSRTLRAGFLGTGGSMEEALLADGVPMDKLYPLDIDRAFRSLDKIKPAITKWWTEGAEGQELFADGVVDLGLAFDARIGSLMKQGAAVAIEWNQGKIQIDQWAIPKGSQNVAAAQRFIEFATRAERQGYWAELIPYSPTNLNALKHMKPETAKSLLIAPENRKKMYLRDEAWYNETNASGKTNIETLIDRWNKWILE
jgi:putative spermidine/putrescine transport system substrate-binding protein